MLSFIALNRLPSGSDIKLVLMHGIGFVLDIRVRLGDAAKLDVTGAVVEVIVVEPAVATVTTAAMALGVVQRLMDSLLLAWNGSGITAYLWADNIAQLCI